jgi:hypothetical protein
MLTIIYHLSAPPTPHALTYSIPLAPVLPIFYSGYNEMEIWLSVAHLTINN